MRVAKLAAIMIGHYSHAHQFNRARRELRFLPVPTSDQAAPLRFFTDDFLTPQRHSCHLPRGASPWKGVSARGLPQSPPGHLPSQTTAALRRGHWSPQCRAGGSARALIAPVDGRAPRPPGTSTGPSQDLARHRARRGSSAPNANMAPAWPWRAAISRTEPGPAHDQLRRLDR